MCTVTFLPGRDNHFILTSNRDEHILRSKALAPGRYLINEQPVYYPKDAHAGGTWIASAVNNYTLCLLNGAFEKHVPAPPYTRSRGIMLLDFYKFNDVQQFVDGYDFAGMEPFTLLLLGSFAGLQLHEFRWDGMRTYLKELDTSQPQVWSSVTLYDPETIKQREAWFDAWLRRNPVYDAEAIFYFHETGGTGDKSTDVLMNRNNTLMTLSITSVQKSDAGTFMKYKDVREDKTYAMRIV